MANLKSVFSRVKGDIELIQDMPLKAVNLLYKARKVIRGDKMPLDLFGVAYAMGEWEARTIIKSLTKRMPRATLKTQRMRHPCFL
jgi:hypothetical protein